MTGDLRSSLKADQQQPPEDNTLSSIGRQAVSVLSE